MAKDMETVFSSQKTETFITVSGNSIAKMEKELKSTSKTKLIILATLKKISNMDTEHFIKIKNYTKVNGKRTKNTAEEFISFPMAQPITVSGSRIKRMEKLL